LDKARRGLVEAGKAEVAKEAQSGRLASSTKSESKLNMADLAAKAEGASGSKVTVTHTGLV